MKYDERVFLLHSNLPSFKNKVARSKEIVNEFLELTERPYVAFSTGKDSTALLGLVREIAQIPAVHLDAGVEFPDNQKIREQFDDVIHHKTDNFLEKARKCGLDSKETRKASAFDEVIEGYDFDGVFLGLRREESAVRNYNAGRGVIYEKNDGMLVCTPLINWTIMDVFAYLVSNNLPIHPIYKRDSPFPLKHIRVGSYVSSRNRGGEFGRFRKLEYFYPELYRELVHEFPELKKY